MEARGGIEPPITVLQTIALPLGDRALTRGLILTRRFAPGEGKPKCLGTLPKTCNLAYALAPDPLASSPLAIGASTRLPHSVQLPS
jgi:hypothetical protein